MSPRRLALVATIVAASHLSYAAPASPSSDALVALIPARARIGFVVRKSAVAPLRDLLFKDAEMMSELSPYLERSLGVDPARVDGIAGFSLSASPDRVKLALILRVDGAPLAPLQLPGAGDVNGTPVYRLSNKLLCARMKVGLVVGTDGEVRAALAVERGREPALANAGLGRLLGTDANDVDLVAAIGPGALPPDKSMGVEDGFLVYRHGGTIELSLHGDPAQLSTLRVMAMTAMQLALARLAQDKATATATNDPMKGAASIVTYHEVRRFLTEVEPKLDGNTLGFRYKVPDPAALAPSLGVVLVGAIAAVAIPAFQRYLHSSKSVEATTNLGRLAEALRMLKLVSKQQKASLHATNWTPKAACCGQPGDRCAPNANAWQTPTWSALGFSIDERHIFQYRVRIEGTGAAIRYIVEARADFDCDGTFTTFSRTVNSDGTLGPIENDAGLEAR